MVRCQLWAAIKGSKSFNGLQLTRKIKDSNYLECSNSSKGSNEGFRNEGRVGKCLGLQARALEMHIQPHDFW